MMWTGNTKFVCNGRRSILQRNRCAFATPTAPSFRFILLLAIFPAACDSSSADGSWLSSSFWSSSSGSGGSNSGLQVSINDVSCSEGLNLNSYSISCGDDSSSSGYTYCTLGKDDVSIEANIQFSNDLSSSSAFLTIEACISYCDTLMDASSVELCNDDGVLSPADGQQCLAAGAYNLHITNFHLPSFGSTNNGDNGDGYYGWENGYAAGAIYFVYVTLDGNDGTTVGYCDIELITAPDEEGWNAYQSVAIAALGGAAIVAFVTYLRGGGRSRRLVACGCGAENDSLERKGGDGEGSLQQQKIPSARFELM